MARLSVHGASVAADPPNEGRPPILHGLGSFLDRCDACGHEPEVSVEFREFFLWFDDETVVITCGCGQKHAVDPMAPPCGYEPEAAWRT